MDAWSESLRQRLAGWKEAGLERRLRLSTGRGVHIELDGRPVVSFASNDYLGLSHHPRVLAAAHAALDASGAGATASRLLAGNKPEHVGLEEDLARFKRTAAALVFPTGYQTALGTLTGLTGGDEGCAVVLDRLVHACLLDGARLSGARVRTFPHNDVGDLKRVLEAEARRSRDEAGPGAASGTAGACRLLVVVESLYSMDGDVAPLGQIYAAARAAGAWLLVDEAHATGVLGPGGRGALAEVFSGALPEDVLSMGTLSKALGSQGGFLCASQLVIEALTQGARQFLFSTGLAPAAAAAARAALAIAQEDQDRRAGLLRRADQLRSALRQAGWKVLGGPGPILPVLVGGESRAVELAGRLLKEGLWAPAVRYPTVPKGAARLRVSLSAEHTDEDIAALAKGLSQRFSV
jgi:8-amino-7-oxononanoate synthase